MVTDVERLVVRMEANMRGYERALQKMQRDTNGAAGRVENRFRQQQRTIDQTFSNIQRNATRMLGLIGVGLSARAFTSTIQQSLQLAETMVDTADRVGFTVEQLQELRFAADQNGSSARTLDMALQRFSRRTGEAAQGTGELRQTITDLGIELRNADGTMRTSHEVLLDYADAIQNAESDQEALRLAFKAFDSEGAQLVTLMRQGRDGVQEFAQRARDASQVMDEGLARNAAEANRALREMRMEIDGKLNTAVAENAEAIRGMGEALGAVAAAAVEAGAAFAGLFQDPRGAEAIEAEIERLESRLASLRLRGDGRGDIAGIQSRIQALRALLELERAQPSSDTPASGSIEPSETPGVLAARERLALQERLNVTRALGDEDQIRRVEREVRLRERIRQYEQDGVANAAARATAHENLVNRLEDETRERQRMSELDRQILEFQRERSAIASEFARELTEAHLQNYIRRREVFAKEFGDTFASGMMAAFNGTLQDYIKRRLQNAMFDALSAAFAQVGRAVFARIVSGITGGVGLAPFGISGGAPFGGKRASGGGVSPSRAYTVGERGPETFVPGMRGSILPNPQSLQGRASGGGGTLRIMLHVGEGPEFATRVAEITGPMVSDGMKVAVQTSRAEIGADMANRQMRSLR